MRTKALIFAYFKKHWLRYVLGVAFVILSTVLATSIPNLMGEAIDLIGLARSDASATGRLYAVIWGIALCAAGAFAARFIWRYLIHGFTRSFEMHLRNELFARLQALTPEFYVKNNTGDLITKGIIDVQGIRMMLGMGLIGIIDVLTINAVTLGYMIATTRFSLTLLAIVPLPVLLYALVKLRTLMRRRFTIVQHAVSDIASKVQENITGIRVIKAFAQERSENEHFASLSRDKWKAEMSMVRVMAFINPLTAVVFGVIFSAFLYIGGGMVIDGTLTLGEFTAFNTYIAFLLAPINRISRIIQIWQRGAVSMQRLDTILGESPAIDDSAASPRITSIAPVDIRVKNLSFAYPGTSVEVLKNLSFELPAGGVLAVMGPTGSGKTTLFSLLMRMWEPPRGAIKISGHDPETIPLDLLRGSVAYVPQDSFLFSDSIVNNIRFYDENISREQAQAAAESAVIHESITELEKGYDTVVGERGMTLSGGQKQRVSIARALARRPGLLLLDDCLSAVDAETEHRILKNLRRELAGCTAIIVTHRIAAAGLADRILLLDENGGTAAFGTHEELLRTSPEYANLIKITESGDALVPETSGWQEGADKDEK